MEYGFENADRLGSCNASSGFFVLWMHSRGFF